MQVPGIAGPVLLVWGGVPPNKWTPQGPEIVCFFCVYFYTKIFDGCCFNFEDFLQTQFCVNFYFLRLEVTACPWSFLLHEKMCKLDLGFFFWASHLLTDFLIVQKVSRYWKKFLCCFVWLSKHKTPINRCGCFLGGPLTRFIAPRFRSGSHNVSFLKLHGFPEALVVSSGVDLPQFPEGFASPILVWDELLEASCWIDGSSGNRADN